MKGGKSITVVSYHLRCRVGRGEKKEGVKKRVREGGAKVRVFGVEVSGAIDPRGDQQPRGSQIREGRGNLEPGPGKWVGRS